MQWCDNVDIIIVFHSNDNVDNESQHCQIQWMQCCWRLQRDQSWTCNVAAMWEDDKSPLPLMQHRQRAQKEI